MFKKNWMVYFVCPGGMMTERFRTFEEAKDYAMKIKGHLFGGGLFIKNDKGEVWLVKR